MQAGASIRGKIRGVVFGLGPDYDTPNRSYLEVA